MSLLIPSKVKDPMVIRIAVILTTSFVACDIINHKGFNRLYLDCEIIKGTPMYGMQFTIEKSMDGKAWFIEQQSLSAGGTTSWDANTHEHLIAANENPYFELKIIANYIKVSFKGLTATDLAGSSLKVTAISSNLE